MSRESCGQVLLGGSRAAGSPDGIPPEIWGMQTGGAQEQCCASRMQPGESRSSMSLPGTSEQLRRPKSGPGSVCSSGGVWEDSIWKFPWAQVEHGNWEGLGGRREEERERENK